MIPHSRPTIDQADIDSVTERMRAGQLAQGEVVAEFERKMAGFIGVRCAVATNSGTSALHLALLALGVAQGDEVIVPSYVCTSLLHAARYVGADPVLADIALDDFNMNVDDVRQRITGRTKCVIVPHMFGCPADIAAFRALGLPVIEDCAMSVGAEVRGHKVGTFGDMAVLSFYATKMMTTAQGGMLLGDSTDMIEDARDLCYYDGRGASRAHYNYRMTDVAAALGLSQLARLPAFIERRRAIAGRYRSALSRTPLIAPPDKPGHVYYRFVARLSEGLDDALEAMAASGVCCERPVEPPLHRLLSQTGFPSSDTAFGHALSIPIFPSLSDSEVKRVVDALERNFGRGRQ